MRLSDFDYELPEELIAQHPVQPRDAARMMVLDSRTGTMEDHLFRDLPGFLGPTDALVLNDTRVIRARMRGVLERARGTSRQIEVFFAEPAGSAWRVLCRPGRRIEAGDRVLFPGGVRGVFLRDDDASPDGALRLLQFETGNDVAAVLEQFGEIPLPPYINRHADAKDAENYQTVFAGPAGAIAAPTAGLHFTPDVLSSIRSMGTAIVHVTLHVGIGTFLPVRADNPENHVLRPERFEISTESAATLISVRQKGGRITAVGTTVTRTLEYALRRYGGYCACSGETDLFILPGFEFKAIDALLTNFHLPKSTLLMLVAAFVGREQTLAAYRRAVERRYRFYSYGDCMLILR
jgi:S-adenosylmethionine:tRNA ribosyltransferase-isomerase